MNDYIIQVMMQNACLFGVLLILILLSAFLSCAKIIMDFMRVSIRIVKKDSAERETSDEENNNI